MSRTSSQHWGARLRRALLTCLVLTVLAVPALAARVVDVRVGQHPTFTRVVFELDQMRGYRLTRDADGDVLVVNLDARAVPKSLAARGMIERVEVEQAAGGAVARIHLKGAAGASVQEMILGKPPRIVLDIMMPEQLAATALPSKPTAEPSLPVVSEPELPVVPEPEPEPVEPAVDPTPAPTPAPELPVVNVEPEPPVVSPAPVEEPVETATLPELPVVEPVEPVEPMEPVEVAEPVDVQEPVEIARATPTPKPVMPEPTDATSESAGPGLLDDPMLVGGAVALLVLVIAGFWLMRRGKAVTPADEEWSPDDEEEGTSIFDEPASGVAEGASDQAASAMESHEEGGDTRIPAGGFEMGAGASEEPSLPASFEEESDPFGASESGLPAEEEVISAPRPDKVISIFDTDAGESSATQGDSSMDDMMSDLPADPSSSLSGAAPPPPMMSGGDAGGDVARMMEAMERRMSELESRLDEANEAREKLERQVAAQAEELRVQRAAIARTQRALRGMNRGGDDRASEPALREDTQARTRVTGGA